MIMACAVPTFSKERNEDKGKDYPLVCYVLITIIHHLYISLFVHGIQLLSALPISSFHWSQILEHRKYKYFLRIYVINIESNAVWSNETPALPA